MNLVNKTIVVTGAASGIGRELTRQLVSLGARVAMVDVNADELENTARLAGRRKVSVHVANIADRRRVEELPAEVMAEHGAVDSLINNAGIIQPNVTVAEMGYLEIEQVFDVNFYGTLYMVKAFLPALSERPVAHIANVSCIAGFIPFPGQSVYSASKAAVKALTEGLYAELRHSRVGVSIVLPGMVDTDITVNSGLQVPEEDERFFESRAAAALSAGRAAEIIIAGIIKKKFRILVGNDARFFDLFYRFRPRRAVDYIGTRKPGLM